MALKKTTITFLPDGARKVRQFRIPKAVIYCFSLFALMTCGIFAWACIDYKGMKLLVSDYTRIQQENQQHEIQISALSQKIEQINSKMVELQIFTQKLKVMANLETEDNTQFLGVGGSDPEFFYPEYSIEEVQRNQIRQMHQSLTNVDTEASVQMQDLVELYDFMEDQKSMFACTPSIWPSRGWVSSRFGYRISPFTNEKEFHKGLDISARIGTPVIVPADGVVSSLGEATGYGKILTISHGYGLKTRYAHLNDYLVKKGESVSRGQKVALMGNSGRSTGPHLHYEVYLNGVPVDPLRYILN